MEKGKKRIRICLVCVVLTAIVVGLFYYYHQVKNEQENMQGTLIANVVPGTKLLWQ